MNYLEQELNDLIQKDTSVFQFIAKNATDGIWFWDLEKREEEWMNKDFWKTLGYDPKKMPHKSSSWKNIIHPDDLLLAKENLEKHCKNPRHPYDIVVRYTHQFGNILWIRCRGMVIRDHDGKPSRMLGIHTNITELEETKLMLESQKELNRHILESSEIGSWEWNTISNTVDISDQWAGILGYTKTELGKISFENWQLLLHRDDYQRVLKEINFHLESVSEKLEFETRLKHKKGHWVWLLYKGKVITRNNEGYPILVIGTQQDITNRKRNELLLTSYKSLVETTTNASSIGTWEVDLNTMTSYWSDVTKKIHEVSDDFISTVENGIKFYKEGENRDKITKLFNETISDKKQFDDVFEIVTATGNIKYVRAIGVPIVKNGKVISVNGLFQDVDAETRLNQKIKLQEEQFRKTFEFAAIGMAIVGLDGKWIQVNKSLTKMLGYTEAEFTSLTFQDITHPEDLKSDLDLLEQLTNRKIVSYTMEKRYFHKDGSIIWADLSVSMVTNNSGLPKHFVSQINNITKAKSDEIISQESLLKLEDQNDRLLNFAHIVSHNLRSHASNFAMLLEIYKADFPEQTENEIFPMLNEASGSLLETIEHLNEVVHINTSEEKMASVMLLPKIESVLLTFSTKIQDLKAEINIEVDPKIRVQGIPAYIESIMLNLISNALKYRNEKKKPRIDISTSDTNSGMIAIRVKDNGVGIDLNKNGHHMFKMYKTFHKNSEARGIGLFITKNQCEAMNGTIEVMSEVGIGTTFVVSLIQEKEY